MPFQLRRTQASVNAEAPSSRPLNTSGERFPVAGDEDAQAVI